MEGAVYNHPDLMCVSEFIKNKLYFATVRNEKKVIRCTRAMHFFSIDDELVYNNFYHDFGPLNIACLYRYCCTLKKKLLRQDAKEYRQIVHYTSRKEEKRSNAAYLIASYAVLYLKKTPSTAYRVLHAGGNGMPLKPFQDASIIPSAYNIYLLDCLNAIDKAAFHGFFNFDDFNLAEYETYEQMRNGAFNWTVPQKFLAFVGPSTEPATIYHPPESYIDYFLNNNIVAVIRLNKRSYDASVFTRAGISHYDMFMPDGTVPSQRILKQFLTLAENTSGSIAVHCKAGLGRTGSLIAAYLIKHYAMTAREAIAWVRICRPGSVIGHQQDWLESMEASLLNAGREFRLKHYGDRDRILCHERGIYSNANNVKEKLYKDSRTCGITCNRYCKKNDTRIDRILGDLDNIGDIEHQCHRPKVDLEKSDDTQRVCALPQGDKLAEIMMNKERSFTKRRR